MRIASFFSGIGGLERGLEWALDAETVFQCEKDPYARRVLERHWPGVQRHDDITTLDPADIPDADLWCGGFPCQDISSARNRHGLPGLSGDESGLWHNWFRLIEARTPCLLVIENTGCHWKRWVPSVRRSLDTGGYASVPLDVSASAVGAPFEGRRVFVTAAYRDGEPALPIDAETSLMPESPRSMWFDWGPPPPEDVRVDDGIPFGVDRVRCLGNAVVPQVAYVVGLRLNELLKEEIS